MKHFYGWAFFLFLNHPASLVSFGMDTDLETLEFCFVCGDACSEYPEDIEMSFSSCRRLDEDANFLSFDIGVCSRAAVLFLLGGGGAREGLPDWEFESDQSYNI